MITNFFYNSENTQDRKLTSRAFLVSIEFSIRKLKKKSFLKYIKSFYFLKNEILYIFDIEHYKYFIRVVKKLDILKKEKISFKIFFSLSLKFKLKNILLEHQQK
jgi:hypothetical protein